MPVILSINARAWALAEILGEENRTVLRNGAGASIQINKLDRPRHWKSSR